MIREIDSSIIGPARLTYLMKLASDPNDTIESAISLLRREGHVQPGDKLIVATDILAQDRLVDSVQLRTVR